MWGCYLWKIDIWKLIWMVPLIKKKSFYNLIYLRNNDTAACLHLAVLPLQSAPQRDSCWTRLAPLPVFSSICPRHPSLPHLLLHFSHLDSILGCLFTVPVFQHPFSSSSSFFSPLPAPLLLVHHLSLTLSSSPLPCYLLSVCPCRFLLWLTSH